MEARRKHYDEEFKASAVAMLSRGDRSRRQVASDLGVNYWTLSDWYTRAMTRRRHGPSATLPTSSPTEETAAQRIERLERENKALLKENEQLRMDRAILKNCPVRRPTCGREAPALRRPPRAEGAADSFLATSIP